MLEQELRFAELDYQETLLQNYVVGVVRKLPRGLSLGLSYKREKERTRRGTRLEDRTVLDLGWGRELLNRWKFDFRARSEARSFRRDAAHDAIRFRFRFRLRTKATLGPVPIRPFIRTELFTGHRQPLRNRLGVGLLVELNEHVGLQLAYWRQDTRGREALNILGTGVELSF